MKKVKLTDNNEVEVYGIHGGSVNFQNAYRDCLTFEIDSEAHALAEIDSAFTPENCENITIIDETEDETGTKARHEYIYEGYTLRRSLEKSYKNTGGDTKPIERIYISMAQKSHIEREQAAASETLTQQAEINSQQDEAIAAVYEMLLTE